MVWKHNRENVITTYVSEIVNYLTYEPVAPPSNQIGWRWGLARSWASEALHVITLTRNSDGRVDRRDRGGSGACGSGRKLSTYSITRQDREEDLSSRRPSTRGASGHCTVRSICLPGSGELDTDCCPLPTLYISSRDNILYYILVNPFTSSILNEV